MRLRLMQLFVCSWLSNGYSMVWKINMFGFVRSKSIASIFTASLLLGNFSCHVSNDAGDGEYSYELVVYTLPSIANITQNQTIISAIESRNVSIECPAYGVPTPKVSYPSYVLLFLSNLL